MNKKIGLIILIFLLAGAVGGAVWYWSKGGGGGEPAGIKLTGRFTDQIQPLNVGSRLSGAGVNKKINQQGGTIELRDGSIKATLVLPEKSVIGAQNIGLTRIISLSDLSAGASFVAGVALSPDGLRLVRAGQLTVDLPPNTDTNNLFGFSYSGEGRDFYLYPIKIVGSQAVFNLSGFSGYGLINFGSGAPKIVPSTAGKQARQYIATLIQQAGPDSLSESALRDIQDLLGEWYSSLVKPRVVSAQNDGDLVDQAAYDYLEWLQSAQALGLDDRFVAEIDVALRGLAVAIKNAVNEAAIKCVAGLDPKMAGRMLHLSTLAQLLGIDGEAGIDMDDIIKKAAKCARFELKITSSLQENNRAGGFQKTEASGSAALNATEMLTLAGEGNLKVEKLSNEQAVCLRKKPVDYQIIVPDTKLEWKEKERVVQLRLTFVVPEENEGGCGDYMSTFIPEEDDGSQYMREIRARTRECAAAAMFDCSYGPAGYNRVNDFWSDRWLDIFMDAHADEMRVDAANRQVSFVISNWQILDNPEAYAKKTYNRSKPSQYGGETIIEDTVLELIHTPGI